MRAYHLFDNWLAESRPDKRFELFDIYVPIKPITKERPRGGFHTPIKTRKWTDYVGECVAEIMEGQPTITFPVSAAVIFGLTAGRKPGDTDNLEKALWDALQRGDKCGKHRAIQDDKFIRGHIEKSEREMPKGEEFLWVRFYARNESDYAKYTELINV